MGVRFVYHEYDYDYQFPKKKQLHLEQISPVETMSLIKNYSILEIA